MVQATNSSDYTQSYSMIDLFTAQIMRESPAPVSSAPNISETSQPTATEETQDGDISSSTAEGEVGVGVWSAAHLL